jgi:nucleoid-associated protein YgaU
MWSIRHCPIRSIRSARDARRPAVAAALVLAALLAAAPDAPAQSLRGSPASVDLMYTSARGIDLAFLATPASIYQAAVAGDLKLISITENLDLDGATFPFVLPNTLRFADSLAAAYHAGCGERLVVTSGARPIDEQPRNASPKSVHPTGMAVDFRKPSNPVCLAWLRKNLVQLEDAHVIEATEEHHPPHFHVAVLHQQAEPVRLATNVRSAAPATGSASGDLADVHSYTVRAGDNLWTIARRYSTTSDALEKLNHLHSSRIRVGQVIRLR